MFAFRGALQQVRRVSTLLHFSKANWGPPSGFSRGATLSMLLPATTTATTTTPTTPTPFAVQSILQLRGNAGTKKKKLSAVVLRNEVKVAGKRKGKHYKLKNHKGAATRWLIKSPSHARGPVFKRAQAGTSHLNRKNRAWKTRAKRRRVVANAQQAKLLRRLIPYHRKKYMR